MMEWVKKLIHELREVVNPVIFLFCMFELVAITNWLLLESYSITPTHTVVAAVGALIGGNAILIAKKLPYLHIFQGWPVLISVLWLGSGLGSGTGLLSWLWYGVTLVDRNPLILGSGERWRF